MSFVLTALALLLGALDAPLLLAVTELPVLAFDLANSRPPDIQLAVVHADESDDDDDDEVGSSTTI